MLPERLVVLHKSGESGYDNAMLSDSRDAHGHSEPVWGVRLVPGGPFGSPGGLPVAFLPPASGELH